MAPSFNSNSLGPRTVIVGNAVSPYDARFYTPPGYVPLAMADDWSSETMDAKWTSVVSGSGAAISDSPPDPIVRPSAELYSLSARPGQLLLQPRESHTLSWYQTLSLGTNEQMIVTMGYPNPGGSAESNDVAFGVAFNNNIAGYTAGTANLSCYYDGTQSGALGGGRLVSTILGSTNDHVETAATTGHYGYLWIVRASGNTVHVLWSATFDNWSHFATYDVSTSTYFWIFSAQGIYGGSPGSDMEPILNMYPLRHNIYVPGASSPWPLPLAA